MITGCVPAPGSDPPGAGCSYANLCPGCVPAAAYPVPDMSGSTCRMQTGRIPAVSRLPAWYRSWWGGQHKRGPFRFGPAQGPESAWLSRIRCGRDEWYILLHPFRSRIIPTRQAKIHVSFRGPIINRAIFCFHHTIFPVGLFPTNLQTPDLQTSGLIRSLLSGADKQHTIYFPLVTDSQTMLPFTPITPNMNHNTL